MRLTGSTYLLGASEGKIEIVEVLKTKDFQVVFRSFSIIAINILFGYIC